MSIISRFCNSTVLPHDFRATATDIRTNIEEIDAAAEGAVDFDPVYNRLDELEDHLDEFVEHVNGVDTDEVVTNVEDVQVHLGDLLIPALYMESPEYEHEPALPHEFLPYLRIAEDLPDRHRPQEGFARTKITRGAVKFAHRIGEAADVVQVFIETHE